MEVKPELHAGTLSDEHILNACEEGWLIDEGFCKKGIRQACYELRASNIYYELDRVSNGTTPTRHELSPSQFILIKPKQLVTIITMESLKFPDNILGRVLTKGQLFSIGIIPVNTYADPGFRGRLGITLANFSNNYVKIPLGEPIAKIEFSKLRRSVKDAYDGQHGYKTAMWPVPSHMLATRSDLADDPRLPSLMEELETSHGRIIADISRRMFYYFRYLVLATVLYLFFTIILIAWLTATKSDIGLSTVAALAIGLVTNAAFAVLVHFATRLGR